MNEVTVSSSAMQAVMGSSSGQAKGSKVAGATDAVGVSPNVAVTPAEPETETAESQAVKQAKLDDAVSRLNDFVQSTQRDLYFNYDDDLGKTIVTVVDRKTDEVIRKIPSELALQLAEKLNEDEPVRLFSAQA